MQAGPTVIPTLAARSRLRQRHDLAWSQTHPPCRVEPDPPLALLSYLRTTEAMAIDTADVVAPLTVERKAEPPCVVAIDATPAAMPGDIELALELQQPEREASQSQHPMPHGMELLIWLVLLLVDGALALRDLLRQRRSDAIHHSRGATGMTGRCGANTWLGADLNPAGLA